ncbi:MAG TPA: translational GTPase TypA [Gemmatimonadales bacterium]|nr:translational GTPase TypA [Gemmatimonadales bacterium]
MSTIRNIAIIAHVDHGKTTLVDQMLRQAGVFRAGQHVVERVMDSNPLERERGITILAKNTSVRWGDVKINIVDTPGHADFGGEVERILRMVDGVLILVDAAEGPMPQTRFVTRKALGLGLKPIVVINKIDRQDAEPLRVHDEVLELFLELDASSDQLDAPFLYASSRHGVAFGEESAAREWVRSQESAPLTPDAPSLTPLFEAIVAHVPPPKVAEGPFQMLVSTLDHSPYVGRIAIGRIERGVVKVGDTVALLPTGEPGLMDEGTFPRVKVLQVHTFEGLNRLEVAEAAAGDIVALSGLEGIEIGQTVTDPAVPERMAGIAVEEPTISVDFIVNSGPLAGREGKYVTSRQLRERLFREVEKNVAMRVEETDSPDTFKVSGRGELHLSILMETMRREGYEFLVSRPRVITHEADDGTLLEPYEELLIDVPESCVGIVMEKLGPRRAELLDMKNPGTGNVRMSFRIPARGLFGYRSDFLTDTRGMGMLNHRFLDYGPWAGPISGRSRGVMVSMVAGEAVGYALFNLQERGVLFVKPGDVLYEGMIVGEHVRSGDLDVNPTKGKKLTNMRASGSDENILLEPPRAVTLELALEYIEDDELIEVTPRAVRLRKRALTFHEREKLRRAEKKAAAE